MRVHVVSSGTGTTILAHEACAKRNNAPVLYRLLPDVAVAR
ncbi:hypothetical protein ACFYY2_29730 [Streptomyces sp. NPDC001822]